ncbi:MAG: site-2 protease family protein, partial [Imperialibacter sp.]
MEALIMTAQLLLGLSILVGLHEFGHLLTAKFFGMRVEKYSIGFPPKIFGFDYRGTEYSIGAIPLGGFVKISGMIDESMDTEHLNKEPEPYEFRAKLAWQRLIVMMGGIIVNVATGIVIFVLLTFF